MGRLISKKLEKECYLIRKKMKNAISIVDIINWLNNFEDLDKDDMLELLKKFRYYNDDEIIEGYRNSMKLILSQIQQGETLYINTIGAYGKSGTGMIYFFKKAMQGINYKEKSIKINYILSFEKIKRENIKNIILIDDFLGSGNTAKEYYDKIQKKICMSSNVFFLSFACTDTAYKYLTENIKNVRVVYNELETKIFSTKSNTLGTREKIKRIRETAYKYAKENNLSKDKSGYLGYENSQCIIGFSFGTPNNTLPIFWNNRNEWFPLFPRFTNDKIAKIRKQRNEIFFELSMAYTLDISEFRKIDYDIDINKKVVLKRINYQTLALLKYKFERKGAVSICRTLGISSDDYECAVGEAINRNLLDEKGNLTFKGREIYNKIVEKVRLYKSDLKKYDLYEKTQYDGIYVPSIFCGKS